MKNNGFTTFMKYLYPFLLFVGLTVAISRSLDEPTVDNSTQRSFSVTPLH